MTNKPNLMDPITFSQEFFDLVPRISYLKEMLYFTKKNL